MIWIFPELAFSIYHVLLYTELMERKSFWCLNYLMKIGALFFTHKTLIWIKGKLKTSVKQLFLRRRWMVFLRLEREALKIFHIQTLFSNVSFTLEFSTFCLHCKLFQRVRNCFPWRWAHKKSFWCELG